MKRESVCWPPAGAVALPEREGYLFRHVFGWTLLLIAILSALVLLQSTSISGWMIPASQSR